MFQETPITYGFADSPYGEVLIARTEKGICWLSFVMEDSGGTRTRSLTEMIARLKALNIKYDQELASRIAKDIFENQAQSLLLDLRGAPYHKQVWDALLKIPYGHTVSYQDIAVQTGNAKGARAVGQAVGANPVSILVPCHRVLKTDGSIGGYAWGIERKKKILVDEKNGSQRIDNFKAA